MALFYQHNINDNTSTAIWRIEEPEDFFLKRVPVKQEVSHPYKRLQHLAGRYLLPYLASDFPLSEILIADTRKPFLENERYHFSISHCGYYAAAIISSRNRVGVDIELVTPRILSISGKFLNAGEKNFLAGWETISHVYLQLATILWSSKEAIFKWYGNGQVDFRRHIQLTDEPVFRPNEWIRLSFAFRKNQEVLLEVQARIFEGLVLAYVVS